MTTKQAVEIVGPNLRDQSEGDFHAHAANCADLNKGKYAGHAHERASGKWITEASSHRDIIEEVYGDFLPTDDNGIPTVWTDFQGDVKIFPCVKLPVEAKVGA